MILRGIVMNSELYFDDIKGKKIYSARNFFCFFVNIVQYIVRIGTSTKMRLSFLNCFRNELNRIGRLIMNLLNTYPVLAKLAKY